MEHTYKCMNTKITLKDPKYLSNNDTPNNPCLHEYNLVEDDPQYKCPFEDLPDNWSCPKCGGSKDNYHRF